MSVSQKTNIFRKRVVFQPEKEQKHTKKAFIDPDEKGPLKTQPRKEHSFWVILSHQHAFSPLLFWIIIQFLSITSRAQFFIKQLTRDR
jgi:hypothetical protein